MNKSDMYRRLKMQLANDLNCNAGDFDNSEHRITVPALNDGRRNYNATPSFFQMATLGNGVVISADSRIHSELRNLFFGADGQYREGHRFFEYEILKKIDAILQPFGEKMSNLHHMFLPSMELVSCYNAIESFPQVEWFEASDFAPGGRASCFYETKQFPNAICPSWQESRPDVLAVAAYVPQGTLSYSSPFCAMAGCSADSSDFWQVGIDVAPEFRGKGLGSYLVDLLTKETLRRGKIPFYGTASANVISQNIARNTGYFPAWVETESAGETW